MDAKPYPKLLLTEGSTDIYEQGAVQNYAECMDGIIHGLALNNDFLTEQGKVVTARNNELRIRVDDLDIENNQYRCELVALKDEIDRLMLRSMGAMAIADHEAALGTNWRALAERRLEDNEGLIQQIKAAELLYAELKDMYAEMTSQRDEWKKLYQDTRALLEDQP
jgi:hypothetical protein